MHNSTIYACQRYNHHFIVKKVHGFDYGLFNLQAEVVSKSSHSLVDGLFECEFMLPHDMLPAEKMKMIYGVGRMDSAKLMGDHREVPSSTEEEHAMVIVPKEKGAVNSQGQSVTTTVIHHSDTATVVPRTVTKAVRPGNQTNITTAMPEHRTSTKSEKPRVIPKFPKIVEAEEAKDLGLAVGSKSTRATLHILFIGILVVI